MVKILTVEDSGLIRAIIKKFVQMDGHEILEAVDGQDAVSIYKEHLPELVFMDINLPGSINGLDATKQIKLINPNAKIVICSIVEDEESKKIATELGIKDYLQKPFSKDDIVKILHKYLKVNLI